VLFWLVIIALLLFVGLGVDLGFAYITRARLSKAVDAACLMGVRNLSQGDDLAKAIARSTFDANYGVSGRDAGPPDVQIDLLTDSHNNRLIDIKATAKINTFFIRILPQWSMLTVASSAEATRTKLIMTLVLDRSGSMNENGGADALPPAVTSFISFFDDTIDNMAMVSFASHVTVDVPMGHNFKGPITAAVQSMSFTNGTFAQGGLTNALLQNASIPVAAGDNVLKVTVFFTDGIANTIQDTLDCPGPTLWNFGGSDDTSRECVAFNFPDTENLTGWKNCFSGDPCPLTTQFRSAINGTLKDILRSNVTADAQIRSIQTTVQMQQGNTVVFAIGLGDNINSQFLLRIANDPASAFYDPSLPTGQAVFAPTGGDLQRVFQAIASQIVLRLTR
jgi:Flp pilus assembly protein TadG